ncbi:Cytosolic Fe-S cluster assembly factor NARFL [Gracilariopsis chorda]|uniref:Cytosolic Fe-S cluster assembly factor NARFL n=1 Tax=Gracilariopsis chorda TaxID=448386 RepID=A0A2V3J885_9FLOR|nr:Cytosolic Fe-S cluster assembly factor NARFL [Gracilariopsis chorda]|eukprot:PXF50122.1 Cytosolic Fe-S cluster assembly factor NARFL [Gracilariopsis chorda]
MAKQTAQLSNVLRITDVNDFLAPSAACILPLEGGAQPSAKGTTAVVKVGEEPAGSVLTPIVPMETPVSGSAKARVTVSDCLACSGCVTSAETVLLSTASLDEYRSFATQNAASKSERFSIVALSQQSVASIAVHFGLQMTQTARKLATFFRRRHGIDIVIDLSLPRQLSLLEAATEFIQRYRAGKKLTITSACPGWVTYAEKTQKDSVLDCISSIRSPQGILGSMAPHLRPSGDRRPVWVCAVMPCHDKKIEASRPEFVRNQSDGSIQKDIDCVITTGELLDLLTENQFDLISAEQSDLGSKYSSTGSHEFGVNVGSSSGGYAEFVLRVASRELFGIELPRGSIITEKASRSGDLRTATVSNKDGEALTFATAYGFRCLQTILRKVRQGQCKYNYIELMACPGGCTNGGGQISIPGDSKGDLRSWKLQADNHLKNVNSVFHNAPEVLNPLAVSGVRELYNAMVKELTNSDGLKPLRMPIQSRQTNGIGSLSW